MNRTLLLLAALLFSFCSFFNNSNAFASKFRSSKPVSDIPNVLDQSKLGSVKGQILDKANGEPLPFANVALYDNDKLITGTITDMDGNYHIRAILPGKYELKVSYMGYETASYKRLKIRHHTTITLEKLALQRGITLPEVTVTGYKTYTVQAIDTPCAGHQLYGVYEKSTCHGPMVQYKTLHAVAYSISNEQLSQSDLKTDNIQLYPNPAEQHTNLQVFLVKGGETAISIFDATGQQVQLVFKGQLDAGQAYRFPLELSHLSAGYYLCRVLSGEVQETRKLIVAH